ncbi:hypothetical protein MIND_01052300 [Mycena indigotica]|uniref:Uncharacterized protein n=1 Tax=Mycena indigotica TaxID=2126181 RepID=A0A8H6S962_9AGAR|nr:uncharacterized protein MIND_01052300 [Mycena indigotica]KAF7295138.1 hypothetical protein MIND_01052300 [Mycena indigotica]
MAANFTPSPSEMALVSQIFATADPNKLGALTGEVAVQVFGGAHLSPLVLGEIWQIADETNNGWLSTKGVAMAVRLMGHAQQGTKVSAALLNKPGPLPTIAGITPVVPQGTGNSASRAKSPQPTLPPFTPQDRAKFLNMFTKSGPVDGLLSSEKAQGIFLKSKLPNETLGLIWNLADTQDRGKLDSTDFAIGMYLIQAVMTGQLASIPNSLPPGFYQQAAGSNILPSLSVALSNPSTLARANKRFSHRPLARGLQSPPQLPVRPNPSPSIVGTGAFASSQVAWDITPSEKATSDRWFDSLDTHKRGYILDDVAVPFMLESKLTGEDLAQIWDLADVNNNGQLTRDGFAIAWYLIQKKRAGVAIPATLPPTLIPPSMRGGAAIMPEKDLFSWDDPVPTMSTSQTPSQSFAIASADLLGDDEDTTTPSPPLDDKSAEIGNVQNQVNSTSKSLATAQAERQTLETTLANQAAQLSALQTQLSTAKAAYETENKLLAGLRDRHTAQTTEMLKTQEELIRAESDLSALRVEKAEIEGAFLRDKEEARTLQKKMVEAGHHIDMIKVEIDQSKKEAKQQKGLLAIARKQLSSKESERGRTEKELEVAQSETESIVAEKNQIEASIASFATSPERTTSSDSVLFAAAQTLPASPVPDVSSPSLASSIKSNNPFDRLMGNATPRSQSPFPLGKDPATGDPFGFAQAFDSETPAEHTDLVPSSTELTVDDGGASDSDVFLTPVTTTASTFPAIDNVMAGAVIEKQDAKPEAETTETDLGTQLKELDVEDSDSSDSEDGVPLAALVQFKATEASDAPSKNDVEQAQSASDDAFVQPSVGTIQNMPPLTDAFGMPMTTFAPQSTGSAVNAFDEAMNQTTVPSTQFNAFDSAFDDNFDFGGSPPLETPSAVNGHAIQPPSTDPSNNNEFDHIFTPEGSQAVIATPIGPSIQNNVETVMPVTATQPTVLAANGTATSVEHSLFGESSTGSNTEPETRSTKQSQPFPINSPTSSPKSTAPSQTTSRRSVSPPPRHRSPPPPTRSGSKGRPSTGSSKDEKVKEKESHPARSSKLSIRLPFGKRKNKSSEPLPGGPSHLLTPPQEEPARIPTPAVDDDVEAVKQLTAMGFSRSQAVDALEIHGYDVPKALNSLLGAQ